MFCQFLVLKQYSKGRNSIEYLVVSDQCEILVVLPYSVTPTRGHYKNSKIAKIFVETNSCEKPSGVFFWEVCVNLIPTEINEGMYIIKYSLLEQ